MGGRAAITAFAFIDHIFLLRNATYINYSFKREGRPPPPQTKLYTHLRKSNVYHMTLSLSWLRGANVTNGTLTRETVFCFVTRDTVKVCSFYTRTSIICRRVVGENGFALERDIAAIICVDSSCNARKRRTCNQVSGLTGHGLLSSRSKHLSGRHGGAAIRVYCQGNIDLIDYRRRERGSLKVV